MIQLGREDVLSLERPEKALISLQEHWITQYGPLVADQLRPNVRYTLIRIGTAEFAYTDFDRYVRALGQAWEGSFIPEPLPSAADADLVRAAPNLRGVDLDLTDFSEADFAPPRRRFS